MVKPVILTLDDDGNVLSAITRDLRARYGERYRIMRADSGPAALASLQELKKRRQPVALFLIDQRMPEMSGVEFLAEARKIFPDARRVLLTAYADTSAAIQAINTAAIQYYLTKPWDPPEERLYPVLDDLLEDWHAGYREPFSGLHIIGHRWSPAAHGIKDFLARNHVPYEYLDVEQNPKAVEELQQRGLEGSKLPVVVLTDGTVLEAPELNELAERVGLRRRAEQPFYDLAIVGGGPAGLAAAVYGASEGLRTVLIERQAPGGQAGSSSRIENYLGFPSGLSGADLARRAVAQARRFGVEFISPQEAAGLRIDGQYFVVRLVDGSEINCHALVIATGLEYHKLNVPGVEALVGAGAYYGASLTEAASCQEAPVFTVGAGNSAGQAALYLANYASEVHMLVRGKSLEEKMSQYLVERICDTPNIQVLLQSEVIAAHGRDNLESLTYRNNVTGEETTAPATALFIFVGARPCTGWLEGIVEMDDHGFVLTGSALMKDGKPPAGWTLDRDPYMMESSVPGVFVVGDVRSGSVKRVASAVGEGSISVQFIHQYLSKK